MNDPLGPGLQTMVMGRPRRAWKPYTLLTAIIALLVVGAVPALMLGSQFIGPWASYRTRGLVVLRREFTAFPPCVPGLQPSATRTVSGPWVDLSLERDYTMGQQCAPIAFYQANAAQAGWTVSSNVDPSGGIADFSKSTDGYSLTLDVECDSVETAAFATINCGTLKVTMSTPTPTLTGSYSGDLVIFGVGVLFFCLLAYAALTNRPFWGRL